jgi:hypothetical protein
MMLADQLAALLVETRQDRRAPLCWRMRRETFDRLKAEQEGTDLPGALLDGTEKSFGGVPIQFGITNEEIGAELISAAQSEQPQPLQI